MGLRPFSKIPKRPQHEKPSKVAPPPVFNKHDTEDLLKGRSPKKGNRKLSISSKQVPIIASQALWIADANETAVNHTINRSNSSGTTYKEESVDEEAYYEEEIAEEEYFEEEIVDPLRRITIRFDEFDEMQTVLHINDYTNGEMSKSWYKRADYDKMVFLARKTAGKAEEREKDLESGKLDAKKVRKIEARGLEAWTPVGATKAKMIKESAIEAVWNEQSMQWDQGINDPDRIRDVYLAISKRAQEKANDRAFQDALIVKQIQQKEEKAKEKKRHRKLFGKTKALVGRTAKATTGGVVKTTKLVGKTTKLTGKVAQVATKTALATATLDGKLLKEAIIPERKNRECENQVMRRPSLSSKKVDQDPLANVEEEPKPLISEEETKKKKLKLLGLVPIPGTEKTYREDRRQKQIIKRQQNHLHLPSWEDGVSTGKY